MYKYKKDSEPQPNIELYSFTGPGMPLYSNHVGVWREYDAERITILLAQAFQAGREAKEAEFLKVLGIFKR